MDYAKESLRLHYEWKGKLEVVPRAAVDSAEALSLAYTPGVATPCLEIRKDVDKSYELTRRWNTVAVVTDGSAVLGLGDIGPEAGMPVMEGKCVLFSAGVGLVCPFILPGAGAATPALVFFYFFLRNSFRIRLSSASGSAPASERL